MCDVPIGEDDPNTVNIVQPGDFGKAGPASEQLLQITANLVDTRMQRFRRFKRSALCILEEAARNKRDFLNAGIAGGKPLDDLPAHGLRESLQKSGPAVPRRQTGE